jgi:hypothetical protein
MDAAMQSFNFQQSAISNQQSAISNQQSAIFQIYIVTERSRSAEFQKMDSWTFR